MISFSELITTTTAISDDEKTAYLSKVKQITAKKGEVLQRAGDTDIKGFYVKSGILRSYTIDEKGKEHVYMFGSEGWIVSDMEMIVSDSSAQLFIDVVEEAEVEAVDVSAFGDIINKVRKDRIEEQTRQLMKRVGVLQNRVIMLMSANVSERYQHFLDTYPDIVQRVPQRMIASYLGVTPEALSKVKSELLRSK